jgi:hypothetical protein
MDEPRGIEGHRGKRNCGVLVALAQAAVEESEESGHTQKVHSIRLDCDEDVILLEVEQVGGVPTTRAC